MEQRSSRFELLLLIPRTKGDWGQEYRLEATGYMDWGPVGARRATEWDSQGLAPKRAEMGTGIPTDRQTTTSRIGRWGLPGSISLLLENLDSV